MDFEESADSQAMIVRNPRMCVIALRARVDGQRVSAQETWTALRVTTGATRAVAGYPLWIADGVRIQWQRVTDGEYRVDVNTRIDVVVHGNQRLAPEGWQEMQQLSSAGCALGVLDDDNGLDQEWGIIWVPGANITWRG